MNQVGIPGLKKCPNYLPIITGLDEYNHKFYFFVEPNIAKFSGAHLINPIISY
jgi:hypothetical protein